VNLFSKYSNACDHNPSTLQTDGQTDKLDTYHSNTALRYASHGNHIQAERQKRVAVGPGNAHFISVRRVSSEAEQPLCGAAGARIGPPLSAAAAAAAAAANAAVYDD